jgi:hypothetical protein
MSIVAERNGACNFQANTQSRVELSDPTGPAGAQVGIRQVLFFKAQDYSRRVHVRFMVDKVVFRQSSFQALRSPSARHHSTRAPQLVMYHPWMNNGHT